MLLPTSEKTKIAQDTPLESVVDLQTRYVAMNAKLGKQGLVFWLGIEGEAH